MIEVEKIKLNDLVDLCLATNELFQADESFRKIHEVNLYTLLAKAKDMPNLFDVILPIQLHADDIEDRLPNVSEQEFITYIGLLDILGALYVSYP